MGSYHDLRVFQMSRKLTTTTYDKIISRLPSSELYALSSQMRRAVTSITFNIAEGFGRKTLKDRIHFLYIARGSAYELEAQLLVCVDLKYMTKEEIQPVLTMQDEVARMLMGLIYSYEQKI
ncbi:four helix bundle protein [uncultured Dialister sp.]|jgi:four helix bundle protein|uniref:four helix bundle protein n=1 Tax=uncultured Dialister sp. TaxID=278064 RepID=UPI0025E429A6|nr:four helix bundle protein [uncultured Dialister sp.]